MRRDFAAALALLLAGWAAILWIPPFSDERVNDLFVYRQLAEPLLDGALPYRDAFLEYPPLAAPAIALPGLLGTGEDAFRAAFAGWTLLLAAAVALLTGALAARTGGSRRRALLAAAAMPLACGAMVRTHFDLAPVALTLAALLLLAGGRPRAGLAVLGLGAMTKGFPLLAAPPALAWLVANGERRQALEGAACLVAVLGVLAVAAVAVSPSGAADAFTYQVDRPVQVESSPATVLLALDALGAGEAQGVSSHRSDGLTHPAGGFVSGVFIAVLLVALVAFAAYARRGTREMVLAGLAAVAAYVALGRVLSPQYVIWLAPLGALAFAWRMHAAAAAIAAATVLTQIEFPAHYFDVVEREPAATALVALRNSALLLAVSLLAAEAARYPSPGRSRRLRSARRSATDLLRRSRTSPG
ncbi:MAG TPA: glycosyltransferase 87 family protein [Thermoleophilaceae bacterium]|nr:glycosyltransferase 87 family protein [Thermoleophilaceae bacterium]